MPLTMQNTKSQKNENKINYKLCLININNNTVSD